MPVHSALRRLAVDGRFSVDDAKQLQQLVQSGSVTPAEAKEALERYGDIMDPEAGRLHDVPRRCSAPSWRWATSSRMWPHG